MAQAPFIIQQQLTAITLAYRNAAMIADLVMPRIGVLSPDFKYSQYTRDDAFTIPDSRVGRKSKTNQIDWSATESSSSVVDYGLEAAIPQADINAAAAARSVSGVMPVDPMARNTELLSDLLALGREQRVATLITSTSSYASGNSTTLSGDDQWSASASDPVAAIMDQLDSMLVRPNVGVFGQAVFSKLRRHAKVVAAVYSAGGNAATGGVVARQAIAELFELDAVYVGQGWSNTAKKGQTATMTRLWGKDAAFLYLNSAVTSPTGGVTFGVTAEYGTRVGGTIDQDPDIGLRGGTRVRVGESLKELVLANDCGYLYKAAVA